MLHTLLLGQRKLWKTRSGYFVDVKGTPAFVIKKALCSSQYSPTGWLQQQRIPRCSCSCVLIVKKQNKIKVKSRWPAMRCGLSAMQLSENSGVGRKRGHRAHNTHRDREREGCANAHEHTCTHTHQSEHAWAVTCARTHWYLSTSQMQSFSFFFFFFFRFFMFFLFLK